MSNKGGRISCDYKEIGGFIMEPTMNPEVAVRTTGHNAQALQGVPVAVAAHNHPEAGPQTKALVSSHSLQTCGTSDPQ
jgi:hypothetical protein